MRLPRIIPVLDVLDGRVVRAVGGRRNEYRPMVSRVTDSTEPLRVAHDLLAVSGAQELYVADLDAIRCGTISDEVGKLLDALDVPIWLDAGFRIKTDSEHFNGSHVHPVVGFETAESPEALSEACVFSLDLWNGELFGPWDRWGVESSRDWMGVVERTIERGVRAVIVLDLPAVGSNAGPGTIEVCRMIRERYPSIELLSGGGVRNANDLARFGKVGVDGALIASAIHEGVHFTMDTSA
jgi:phosphoribosylformimino-5-aminoimidazole carboxamide ribotide isomerase